MSDRPFKDVVDRGVALLDARVPEWRARVNPDEIRMSSTTYCVASQVYGGDYYAAMEALGLKGSPAAQDAHGFDCDHSLGSWSDLADEWRLRLGEEPPPVVDAFLVVVRDGETGPFAPAVDGDGGRFSLWPTADKAAEWAKRVEPVFEWRIIKLASLAGETVAEAPPPLTDPKAVVDAFFAKQDVRVRGRVYGGGSASPTTLSGRVIQVTHPDSGDGVLASVRSATDFQVTTLRVGA